MKTPDFIPLDFTEKSPEEMIEASRAFYQDLNKRRTVRTFSSRPVDIEVIENAILAAGTAPSGAHKQPWTYCIIQDPSIKKKIRAAAEEEEYENYHGRMSDEWLKDLEKFGTDHIKPFLEIAPYLIIVFKKAYDMEEGKKTNNYYVNESVGISVGMLLAALHQSGLATLTHTPSPMNFLANILDRPKNERAFLLIPVGYPEENTEVPNITRKSLSEISKVY